VHVDRAWRQRPRAAAIAPAEPVDVGNAQGRPVLGSRRNLGGFAHLALAVAVDLGDGDLGDPVALKERQQVVGEVVPVAAGGVLLNLESLCREPIGRELVEGRVGVLRRRGIRAGRPPRAKVDVAQHDRELALRHRQGPAVLGPAEREVLALAVGAKAQREAGLAWCRLDDLSNCRPVCRPRSLVAPGAAWRISLSRGFGTGVRLSRERARREPRAPATVGQSRSRSRWAAHAAAAPPSPCDRQAGVGAAADRARAAAWSAAC
jgi:hypothetical protein